jgi:hypothetical protein
MPQVPLTDGSPANTGTVVHRKPERFDGNLGFYGTAPIARPAAYTQTYATADKVHDAITSADFPAGGVGAAAGGWDTAANRDAAITRFNALRAEVIDLKNLVNSLIDDLQAVGLLQ